LNDGVARVSRPAESGLDCTLVFDENPAARQDPEARGREITRQQIARGKGNRLTGIGVEQFSKSPPDFGATVREAELIRSVSSIASVGSNERLDVIAHLAQPIHHATPEAYSIDDRWWRGLAAVGVRQSNQLSDRCHEVLAGETSKLRDGPAVSDGEDRRVVLGAKVDANPTVRSGRRRIPACPIVPIKPALLRGLDPAQRNYSVLV
jgi:hypothetical protein